MTFTKRLWAALSFLLVGVVGYLRRPYSVYSGCAFLSTDALPGLPPNETARIRANKRDLFPQEAMHKARRQVRLKVQGDADNARV